MTENTLPDRPSALIRLALDDLRKVEADERYVVDMRDWHSVLGEQCRVCLAGAVMACELEAPRMNLSPYSFPSPITNKLNAIDQFRRGHVRTGITYVSPSDQWEKIPRNRYVPPYRTDREAFYTAMGQLASDLEVVGL